MRDRSPHVLAASIDAPAIRLSLGKLRPRSASFSFIEHTDSTNSSQKNNRLNTGAMPQKIPGVRGLAPDAFLEILHSIYNRIPTKLNIFSYNTLNQIKTVAPRLTSAEPLITKTYVPVVGIAINPNMSAMAVIIAVSSRKLPSSRLTRTSIGPPRATIRNAASLGRTNTDASTSVSPKRYDVRAVGNRHRPRNCVIRTNQ
jgi:hypothetical protein